MIGYDYTNIFTENYYENSSATLTNKYKTISGGISINPGFEYSITDRLSILADYRFELGFDWLSKKSIRTQASKMIVKEETDRKRFEIKSIRIGIGFDL